MKHTRREFARLAVPFLAAALLMGAGQAPPPRRIEFTAQQREDLEEEVSRVSSGLYRKSEPVTLDAVRNALPDNASLIEFAIYHPSDPRLAIEHDVPAEPHYVAYVIIKHGDVQWKDLGPAKEIDHAAAAFRQAYGQSPSEFAKDFDSRIS